MNSMRLGSRVVLVVLFCCTWVSAQTQPPAGLVSTLEVLAGKPAPWSMEVTVEQAGKGQQGVLRIDRPTDDSYRLAIDAMERSVVIERTPAETRLISGHHKVAFIGKGGDADLPLAPAGLMGRLISDDSQVAIHAMMLRSDPAITTTALLAMGQFRPQPNGTLLSQQHGVHIVPEGNNVTLKRDPWTVAIRFADARPIADDLPADLAQTQVDRGEMEWMIKRAVARGTEILQPGPRLAYPDRSPRSVPNGELFWVEEQRVVLLRGTPEETGRAHGQLLAAEAQRCMDSTLSLIGLGKSIEEGKWMPDEFRAAWNRLEPHIPESYIVEMNALAEAAGMDAESFRLGQIFPEFFHCSGFAVMGDATASGKLYHGRVLDYMSLIGLHHSATTFVVAPTDGHAYINVGYAGFVGSVTGMNEAQVSLGEMGGGGVGEWDGVPMSILMRRALEECGTLDEVKQLWTDSPRTCEYFYVWADGKTRTAVGVTATPEKVEFINPGDAHPRLGEGIPNALTLSAGKRLEALRQKVTDQYGQFDETSAIDLMCAPVAMSSNLHNVLFVPEDLVVHIAHGNHEKRAYEMPYTRLDVAELVARAREIP